MGDTAALEIEGHDEPNAVASPSSAANGSGNSPYGAVGYCWGDAEST
jgi:hypothetical protein